jgi:uncharacterized protein (DUF1499 family)
MLRYLGRTAPLAAALFVVWAAAAFWREESVLGALYEAVIGPPDLGPADFETLVRRRTPNDALACPPGFCRVPSNFEPPVYPFDDEELRRRFAAFALSQPRVIPVFRADAPGRPQQDRYVQRSRLMSFPDTIDVRFIAIDSSRSTLAIYSRSQIGSHDYGVNLARIRLWTEGVAKSP